MEDEINSELIKVDNNNLVSARELYIGLGMDIKNYSKWQKKNIQGNDFFEKDKDWVLVPSTTTAIGGHLADDFAISIEFAKHIGQSKKRNQ